MPQSGCVVVTYLDNVAVSRHSGNMALIAFPNRYPLLSLSGVRFGSYRDKWALYHLIGHTMTHMEWISNNEYRFWSLCLSIFFTDTLSCLSVFFHGIVNKGLRWLDSWRYKGALSLSIKQKTNKKLQPCIVRPLCSGILWVHNAIIQIMLVIMENACYVQFRKVFFFLFYCVANIAFQVQPTNFVFQID